jgi:hypothetical protein
LNIFLKFFYGGRGSEKARKIHWVNWEQVCFSKEYEGLRVSRIREFNLALLEKWCCRLYDNQGGFFVFLFLGISVDCGLKYWLLNMG